MTDANLPAEPVIARMRKAQRADHLEECNALGAGIGEIDRLRGILAQVHALAKDRLCLSTAGAKIVTLTGEFAPVEPETTGGCIHCGDEH